MGPWIVFFMVSGHRRRPRLWHDHRLCPDDLPWVYGAGFWDGFTIAWIPAEIWSLLEITWSKTVPAARGDFAPDLGSAGFPAGPWLAPVRGLCSKSFIEAYREDGHVSCRGAAAGLFRSTTDHSTRLQSCQLMSFFSRAWRRGPVGPGAVSGP